MDPHLDRRALLAGLGATALGGLAGCVGETHPELFVFNERGEPVEAAVEMWRVKDEITVVSETLELAPDGEATWQLALSSDPHRIVTDVAGGPERGRTWTPGGAGCCLEVHVGADAIEYGIRTY